MVGDDGMAIRQLVAEDAQRYFDLVEYDRPHLSQIHSGVPDETADKYKTVEDVRRSIINPYPKRPNRVRFGIWDNEIMVGSNSIDPLGDGRGKLGSWIGKEHKDHHYAARARELLVKYAFEDLGLTEVFSEILVGNEASQKSLEKSGFTFAGIDEDRWIYVLKNPTSQSSKS